MGKQHRTTQFGVLMFSFPSFSNLPDGPVEHPWCGGEGGGDGKSVLCQLHPHHQPHPCPPRWRTPPLFASPSFGFPHPERPPWWRRWWGKLWLKPRDQRWLRSSFSILWGTGTILRCSGAFLWSTRTILRSSSPLL